MGLATAKPVNIGRIRRRPLPHGVCSCDLLTTPLMVETAPARKAGRAAPEVVGLQEERPVEFLRRFWLVVSKASTGCGSRFIVAPPVKAPVALPRSPPLPPLRKPAVAVHFTVRTQRLLRCRLRISPTRTIACLLPSARSWTPPRCSGSGIWSALFRL